VPDIFANFNQIWTNFTEIHPVRAALIDAERRSNEHGEKAAFRAYANKPNNRISLQAYDALLKRSIQTSTRLLN